jgi:hypothetical protein
MMRECDLDDNDPLAQYLKRAPMIGTKAVTSCICCLGMPLHDKKKFDSISVRGECREKINHSEIDIKKNHDDDDDDKKADTAEVSKYRER